MKRHEFLTALTSGTFLLALGGTAFAKTVYCVDGCGTPYVNHHEGWARSQLAAGDVIQVGGSLGDCLAMLANGDKLVIIAHGSGTGTGFQWGGTTYTGFGSGANQGTNPFPDDDGDPATDDLPPGWGNLMNIDVDFCSCWSDRDPDGTGTDRSLTDKIEDSLGGGANANGFNDLAEAGVNISISGGNQARADAAKMCLDNDNSWASNPPANRPNTGGMGQPANQQSAAEAIVAACPGTGAAGNVTLTLTYKAPKNSVAAPVGGGVAGCVCENMAPFCGFGVSEVHVADPLLAFPYCFGDGSGNPCPCGNFASPGEGCLTTFGRGMAIQPSGSSSIANDNLVLTAFNVPPLNTGIFYAGKTPFELGNTLFDGLQCTGGDVLRFQGQFAASPEVSDTNFVAQDVFGAFWVPGETVFFQYFSRDNQAGPSPCGGFANLSHGLAVVMTP